jgi:hypothetical protein
LLSTHPTRHDGRATAQEQRPRPLRVHVDHEADHRAGHFETGQTALALGQDHEGRVGDESASTPR